MNTQPFVPTIPQIFKSPYDSRDFKLGALASVDPTGQPDSYYPNMAQVPHWNQKKIGSCVGHAAAKSQQQTEFQETGVAPSLSARWLYAMAKCQDGYAGEGTYPRLVAKIMKDYGVATEATVPNDSTLDHEAYVYNRKQSNIPPAAFVEAAKIKIGSYSFAPLTESGIKAAIMFAGQHRGGIFMLTEIDKNWWTAPDGRVSWAEADILGVNGLRVPSDPATLGGHETYPYAFDKKNGRTIIIGWNSWSDAWAKGGDYWFYLDEWLAHIREVVVTVDLDNTYTAPDWHYTFTKTMRKGDNNSEVVALQHALKISGEFPATQKFTGYFGDITFKAVCDFQKRYASEILAPVGATQPTGFVGSYTLKQLNKLFM